MTRSFLVPIIVPIVAVITLAAWRMVFWADRIQSMGEVESSKGIRRRSLRAVATPQTVTQRSCLASLTQRVSVCWMTSRTSLGAFVIGRSRYHLSSPHDPLLVATRLTVTHRDITFYTLAAVASTLSAGWILLLIALLDPRKKKKWNCGLQQNL